MYKNDLNVIFSGRKQNVVNNFFNFKIFVFRTSFMYLSKFSITVSNCAQTVSKSLSFLYISKCIDDFNPQSLYINFRLHKLQSKRYTFCLCRKYFVKFKKKIEFSKYSPFSEPISLA